MSDFSRLETQNRIMIAQSSAAAAKQYRERELAAQQARQQAATASSESRISALEEQVKKVTKDYEDLRDLVTRLHASN